MTSAKEFLKASVLCIHDIRKTEQDHGGSQSESHKHLLSCQPARADTWFAVELHSLSSMMTGYSLDKAMHR